MTTPVDNAEISLSPAGADFVRQRAREYRDAYGPDAAAFYQYMGDEVKRSGTEPDPQELADVAIEVEELLKVPLKDRDDNYAQAFGVASLKRDAGHEGSRLSLVEFAAAAMSYEDEMGFSRTERVQALADLASFVLKRTREKPTLLAEDVRVTRELRNVFEVSLAYSFSRRCRTQAAQDWARLERPPASSRVLARQMAAADN